MKRIANMGDISTLNFEKMNGVVPAVVQNAGTGEVLMVGFMNRDAVEKTLDTGKVTFYSRTRRALWVKGETSGNSLALISVAADCDNDSLLVKATPGGPVCHTGARTCFDAEPPAVSGSILAKLEKIIADRRSNPIPDSYTARLFAKGVSRIAQKLGEEAVETTIAALGDDNDALIDESADLMYHFLVLLQAKALTLANVEERLRSRMK